MTSILLKIYLTVFWFIYYLFFLFSLSCCGNIPEKHRLVMAKLILILLLLPIPVMIMCFQ